MNFKFAAIGFSLALAVGCGADSDSSSSDDNRFADGKADNFSRSATLTVEGHSSVDRIELDSAFQCDMSQFNTLGGWRNKDTRSFDFPTFRLTMTNAGGRLPKAGDVISATASTNRIIFDGSGFSSEGASQCDLLVEDYLNEGEGGAAGIALTLQECELVDDDRTIRVSGSFQCGAPGFKLLFEPEPEPDNPDDTNNQDPDPDNPDDTNNQDPDPDDRVEMCDLDAYGVWLGELEELATKSRVDQDMLQAHVDGLDCRPISAEPYAAWLEVFDATIVAVGSTIDETDRMTIAKVVAGSPTANDAASYAAWYDRFKTQFQKLAPSASASIDSNDKAILDTYYPARPAAQDMASYELWYDLYSQLIDRFLPSSSGVISEDEQSQIDELLRARPSTSSDDAWLVWFPTFERFFNLAVPSNTAFVSDEELEVIVSLASHAPQAREGAAYIEWTRLLRRTLDRAGQTANADEEKVISAAFRVRPCGLSDEAAAAYERLQADYAGTDVSSFAAVADPTICN